ncbi:MAG: chemotaxis protein CheA [Candidatus Margulisbacteria bacterium]|nr:chemotaxis protein CheA [Candidatus Margulisiibacteriota bacterium]
MNFDINIQDFIDEAEDQIRILNDGLLALEKDKNNEEIINEVFRAAHTLKGGSGLVGFAKMMELTHGLENIFDLIRDKKLALTSAHLDVMFEALDVLMELMGEVDSGVFNTDIEAVSKKLKTILENEGKAKNKPDKKDKKKKAESVKEETPAPVKTEPVATPEPVVEAQPANSLDSLDSLEAFLGRTMDEDEIKLFEIVKKEGNPIYGAFIKIGDSCDVVSLFMFMLFNKIKELGEIIVSNPLEDDLEDDELKEVNVIFSSIVPLDEIKKEMNMPEVEKIEITPLMFVDDAPAAATVKQPEKVAPAPVKQEAKPVAAPVIEKIVEPVVEEALGEDEVIEEEPEEEDNEKVEDASKGQMVVKDNDHMRKSSSTTLRVDSQKIDGLLNLAGELVINKARFVQIESDMVKIFGRNNKISELKDTVVQLMRITNELQEGIMQLRMVPIDLVFTKFSRVVRDLARKLDKKINLVIEGKDTELDKSVVEEINDPLMHLVRNAVDHGIETTTERRKNGKKEEGKITLRAYHQGSSIIIEIQDDGKGIDVAVIREKALSKGLITEDDAKNMQEKDILNLIFAPGFSTAEVVTEVSGRGVGMDVVKKNVDRLNGIIEIITEKGKGSTFIIKLPLTLAIISTLLTRVTKCVYAIPLVNVIEIVEVTKKDISKIAKMEAIRLRNDVINILRMDEVFALGNDNRKKDKVQVVIVGINNNRIGFVVDDLIGEQEVVIKSLDNSLVDSPGIAGASILGDGTVALIIDVSTLIEKVVQGIYKCLPK